MNPWTGNLAASVFIPIFVAINCSATTHYVSLDCTNPVSPYTNWVTAATNIQNAIDASTNGDLILVTNGIYQTGGRVIYDLLTNRVVINKAVIVQSANGPETTLIEGNPSLDSAAVRCAYLANGAILSGFTLTNGATRNGGYQVFDVSGGGIWCESTNNTVTNCILANNIAFDAGGGAYGGTFDNCVFINNSAGNNNFGSGGGAGHCMLNNCLLTGNQATHQGGGVSGCTLNNCTVAGNFSDYGYAGGAESCTLNNCIVYYNSYFGEPDYSDCSLNYCCTTPLPSGGTGNFNDAPLFANQAIGDFHLQTNSPCVNAGNNNYAPGSTDLDGNPRIVDSAVDVGAYEVQVVVPFGAVIQPEGTNVAADYPLNFTGVTVGGRGTGNHWDFGDGTTTNNQWTLSHIWATPGDYAVVFTAFNADNPGGVSATVTVHVITQLFQYVTVDSPNPVAPYTSWDTAATNIQDAVDAGIKGGTILVSNGVYDAVAVAKPVVVQSVNGPAATVIDGGGVVRCVYLANNATLVGFTLTNGFADLWGGGVMCDSPDTVVSNCVFVANYAYSEGGGAFGGTLFNCTIASNTVYSTGGGGAAKSILYGCMLTGNIMEAEGGGGAYRCILNSCTLSNNVGAWSGGADNSTLNNCLLVGNYTEDYGGGAGDCTLNNCTLIGNSATWGGAADYRSTLNNCTLIGNSATFGGGAGNSTLNNCLLAGNSAQEDGGGAGYCTLNNCTLIGNSASNGGGAYRGTLNNCIAYYNSAPNGSNYSGSSLNYCCTTPLPDAGVGNIADNPLFVDLAGGDLHLQTNSPCINSGNNIYVYGTNDLDGNPRIRGGTVDIGAYEFQNPGSIISYAWLQQYGLPTDGSADSTDPDSDGMNNWQEWIAGTAPTNSLSVLKMLTPVATNHSTGVTVSWQSVSGVSYFLQRSSDLSAQPPFSTIQSNIVGLTSTTSYTDTTATNGNCYFYRVGVQ